MPAHAHLLPFNPSGTYTVNVTAEKENTKKTHTHTQKTTQKQLLAVFPVSRQDVNLLVWLQQQQQQPGRVPHTEGHTGGQNPPSGRQGGVARRGLAQI